MLFDVTMRECPFSGVTSYGRSWRKDVLLDVTVRQQGWQALDSCRVCSFEHHEKFCNLEVEGLWKKVYGKIGFDSFKNADFFLSK